MDWLGIIFGAFGGLGLFLFGLHFLSNGFKKVSGQQLQKILEKLTSNPWKGVTLGATITAIIQSSSITMVTLIGLINAGLLNLRQAIGVMLGAEIGTTVTAQIVAFKIGLYYLPLIAIGFTLYFFIKNQKLKYLGQIILGFGILFLGMHTIKEGLRPLRQNVFFLKMLSDFSASPLKGVFAGALFTGIIQSSSASIGIVIALASEKLIGLPAAITLMLGANIGTCITALIASVKSCLAARRTSLAQLIINIIGVTFLLIFLIPFSKIVAQTSTSLPRQIANAHTFFNIGVTLLMMPVIGILVKIVKKIIPGEVDNIDRGFKHLNEEMLNSPSLALMQAKKEVSRMGTIALDMLKTSQRAHKKLTRNMILSLNQEEEVVDELKESLEDYVEKISSKAISQKEGHVLSILNHAIIDIERIADHAKNLMELVQYKNRKKFQFSKEAKGQLAEMNDKVLSATSSALKSLDKHDKKAAQKVLDLEREVNYLDKKLPQEHFKRLKKGICSPETGPTFLDIIRNLERISDHAENIASTIIMDL